MIFRLSLTEEKVKRHQATALHLIVALAMMLAGALLCLAYIFFKKTPVNQGDPVLRQMTQLAQASSWGIATIILGIILTGIVLFRNTWLQQPKVNKSLRLVELVLMLAIGFSALIWQFFIAAAIFGVLVLAIIFALWIEGSDNTRELYVEVSAEGIRLPATARRRFIRWPEVERVLLRHGTFTIDCVDNRLFQWTVRPVGFNAADLEQFSITRITEAIPERIKEW